MPKKQDVIDRLVGMRNDLSKTKGNDLLAHADTMTAWCELAEFVQNQNKDKLKASFDNLENIIHRECRIQPCRLFKERKVYASGRAFILSTVKPNQTAGFQKKQDPTRTGASSVPPPETTTKARPKQANIPQNQVHHVPCHYSTIGSYQESDGANLLNLQEEYEKMKRQLNDARAKLSKTEKDNDKLVEREKANPSQKQYEKMERQLEDTRAKLRQSETDKEHWVDRMSKLTGDRLTRDNPDISDLSDPERPHKLGEKYSQLYDDEWTDAMEKLTDTNGTDEHERRGIDILIDILKKSHESCINLADDQMKKLREAVLLRSENEENGVMDCPIAVQRSLKDAQKQASLDSLPVVQQVVSRELASLEDKYGNIPLDKLTLFVNKCIEICWSMVMQSPRMDFLYPEESQGKKFDKDKFKEFTRSGELLDYLVWPAMVIQKQGSLLVKGSVQPIARKT